MSENSPAMRSAALCAALAAAIALPSCDIYFFVCEPADPQQLAALPERLSDAGLYADISTGELEVGVLAYSPEFELWSDGADKRRWLVLPPGTQIDTSDPDSWRFPIGTRVFKEFARDGVPLETRVLLATGDGARGWTGQSYLWTDDGSDAIAAPLGYLGARGTSHNVPDAGECDGCHAGRDSYVLGFSAVQLSGAAAPGEVAIEELSDRNLVTDPPAADLEVPGDADTRFALGYLHANCGHCHNSDRPERNGERCFEPKNEIDLWLRAGELGAVESTATYRTVFPRYVTPGSPADSELLGRIDRRGFIYQMPPLGTEDIDTMAVARLRRWIESLE